MKTCSRCRENKDLCSFTKNKSSKDGLDGRCKECLKFYNNLYNSNPKNIEKSKLYNIERNQKPEIKEKQKIYNKKYFSRIDIIKEVKTYNQSDKVKQRRKINYQNNKNVWKEYTSKEYVKEKRRKNNKERRKNDPNYKLSINLRVRLLELLKRNKTNKSQSALILLGCTIQECKQYLESQFLPEFTWKNHGVIWEIDHIKPCSKFDLTKLEEQQNCFHYTNLKPIFKTTEIAESFGYKGYIGNRNKSNKYV